MAKTRYMSTFSFSSISLNSKGLSIRLWSRRSRLNFISCELSSLARSAKIFALRYWGIEDRVDLSRKFDNCAARVMRFEQSCCSLSSSELGGGKASTLANSGLSMAYCSASWRIFRICRGFSCSNLLVRTASRNWVRCGASSLLREFTKRSIPASTVGGIESDSSAKSNHFLSSVLRFSLGSLAAGWLALGAGARFPAV